MTETINRKLKVFLCHASEDKPAVRELYQLLISQNWIDPWLDEEKLLPGQDWNMEIEKAVENADAVIVFLSDNSVGKEGYIQRELRFTLDIALEKPEGEIFIIPLRLNDCALPRRLQSWHYVDFFPKAKYQDSYLRLLESLTSKGSVNIETNLPKERQRFNQVTKQGNSSWRIIDKQESLSFSKKIDLGIDGFLRELTEKLFRFFLDVQDIKNHYVQRIAGTLFEFFAMLAFIYATIAQARNIFPISLPTFSFDIFPSLIISTVGVSIMLGFYISDMLGVSHFTTVWHKLSKSKQPVVSFLVISNFLLSIIFGSILTYAKSDFLVSEYFQTTFYFLAAFSQAFLIVPLYFTIFLFSGSILGGLLILLIILIEVGRLPIRLLSFLSDSIRHKKT